MCHAQDVMRKSVVSREIFQNEEEIIRWAKAQNGKGNVFIGRNPRDKDGNVIACTALSLDLDPERPKDSAATGAQLQESVSAARRVVHGFQCGIICVSGNGALVLFPLPAPVDKATGERLGKALEEQTRTIIGESLRDSNSARTDLHGAKVNVDSTWDAARLVKAMGTISTKGDKALWRHARIIESSHSATRCAQFLIDLQQSKAPAAPPAPSVEKGVLDRSKADMALANRLKLQGFSAEDTFRALCQYSMRPGREDDYQRIISKVFGGAGVVSGGESRPVELWTPQNGLTGYRMRENHTIPELPTGFAAIDKATHGLQRGHIFTVGARTNTGKTTFSIGVAYNLCKSGKRVLFLSTETQYQEVWDRYIAVATGVSAFTLQHGNLNGSTERVNRFIDEFKRSHNFIVYDGGRPTIGHVRSALDQAKPDVLIFDYFQHVESRDTKQLEEFVMNLKELAKEKNVAILMCAQLHDGMINPKTNKLYPPTLGSMKNCKVLNDESRVVLLLDWDRDAAQGDGPAAVKAILAKNKGPKADAVLKLDRRIPAFSEEA